jgi:hypothetical protein
MEREVRQGKFDVVDPEDGKYEKLRVWRLAVAGVLTWKNAPGVVPPPVPSSSASGWSWLTKDDLKQFNMLELLYEWHDLFYTSGASSSVQLHKALNKITSGRAYNCRKCIEDDFMYVVWHIEKSMRKEKHQVNLAFRVAVGRNSGKVELLGGTCGKCIAGEWHAGCSHILSALSGLALLQMDLIKAGDVGDGVRTWGQNFSVTSAVPVQSIAAISMLVDGGKLAGYTGFRDGEEPSDDGLERYLKLLHAYATPVQFPEGTLFEIHNGIQPTRSGVNLKKRQREY